MIFSEKWLREWVNPAIDTQSLAEQISMAGLEVDGLLRCLAFSFLCSCILMTVLKGLIMPISDGDCYFEKNLNRSSLFWAFVNNLTLGMLFLCEDL